jgi:hypothetical protein
MTVDPESKDLLAQKARRSEDEIPDFASWRLGARYSDPICSSAAPGSPRLGDGLFL